jgi:predicted nucleic acid-binding protein
VLRGTARAGDERFDRAVGFLRTLEVVELGLAEIVAAGDLDGRLHADGAPLSARDTLVASPAREHGYTLVTRDRDFADVPGLDVVFYDE